MSPSEDGVQTNDGIVSQPKEKGAALHRNKEQDKAWRENGEKIVGALRANYPRPMSVARIKELADGQGGMPSSRSAILEHLNDKTREGVCQEVGRGLWAARPLFSFALNGMLISGESHAKLELPASPSQEAFAQISGVGADFEVAIVGEVGAIFSASVKGPGSTTGTVANNNLGFGCNGSIGAIDVRLGPTGTVVGTLTGLVFALFSPSR